jgi:AGAP005263-PA
MANCAPLNDHHTASIPAASASSSSNSFFSESATKCNNYSNLPSLQTGHINTELNELRSYQNPETFINGSEYSNSNQFNQYRHLSRPETLQQSSIYNNNSRSQVSGSPNISNYTNQGANQLSAHFSSMSLEKSWGQMWGNESVNLMSERNIKSKTQDVLYQTEDSRVCHKDVLRSTLRKVPETASLLQKCRLPFGLLLHPFKDDEVSIELHI